MTNELLIAKPEILTQFEYLRLLVNGEAKILRQTLDMPVLGIFPVIQLNLPKEKCSWVLASIDKSSPQKAHGVCLKKNTAKIGVLDLRNLEEKEGQVEKVKNFKAVGRLSDYIYMNLTGTTK